jgi:hypothetical protein
MNYWTSYGIKDEPEDTYVSDADVTVKDDDAAKFEKEAPPKFVHITGDSALFALDERGRVWTLMYDQRSKSVSHWRRVDVPAWVRP